MNLKDIYKQNWKISDTLEIIYFTDNSISNDEQECHFNIDKCSNNIEVCCSHQSYITKLSKSNLFTLEKVLVTRSESNYLLEIIGIADERILTIKKAMRSMSEEQRLILSNRMKALQKNKK